MLRNRLLVALLLSALVLSACAQNAATPQAPSTAAQPTTAQVIQLQFWHGQSQTQQETLNALIDRFNQSHPDIHVTATYQGTYSDLNKKVTAAIAAGTPPDLAIAYQNDVANYIQSRAVIPLDDLINDAQIGFSPADLKDVYPSFIDRYPQAGNKVYSMAFMRSMEVMYFNGDMVKAVGFDQPPATWDDFMKICQAVSKPPDTYCYELNTDASRFAGWVFSRGGDLLSADGKTVAFNSQAGLDSLIFLNNLFRKDYATVTGKALQDQTDFALGKVAFTFGSTEGLPYTMQSIQQAGKVTNWGIAPDPHTTAQAAMDIYGPGITIFKTSTAKEQAAFTFLKWLMSSDTNSTWVQATYSFPARLSTHAQLTDFIRKNPLYGQALDWLQYGRSEPNLAAWNPIRTYIADALTAVANGASSPQQALDKAASQANAALQGPHY